MKMFWGVCTIKHVNMHAILRMLASTGVAIITFDCLSEEPF